MLSRTNGVTAVIVATKCDLVERSLVPGLISQLQKDVHILAVAADILRPREETEEFMAESPEQNQSPTPAMHTVAKPDWLASNGLPGLCFPMRLTRSRSMETEQLWASAADALGSTICLAYRFPNGLTPGVLSRALVRLHWPEYVKFYYLSQWKDGTLMVSQDGAFLLQVTKQEKPEEEEDAVLLELRSRQLLGADLETTLEAAGRGHEHEPANAFELQLESAQLMWQHLTPVAKFYYLSQWKDGTLMVSQDGAFLLQVTKQEKPEEEEDAVLLELRSRQLLGADLQATLEAAGRGHEHQPANAFELQLESAQLMWQHLTPVAKVFESTLLSYKGLWFRRGLRCFHCREITFAHGWVEEPKTKWNQNRKCQACGQKTPICFLTSLLSGKLGIAFILVALSVFVFVNFFYPFVFLLSTYYL
nr:unnamed protein product [Spirometra erinaceieuropaei]